MGGASSRSDNDVSGAEAVTSGGTTYSSKKINTKKKPVDYNPEKDDTKAKLDLFINDPYTRDQGGPIPLRPLEPFFDKSAKATREFFTNKVLESKRAKSNIGYTKDEFSKLSRTKQEEVYKGYMSKRMDNKTDAYGNTLSNLGQDDRYSNSKNSILDNNANAKTNLTQPIDQFNTLKSPTNAEVTQAQSTTMSADEILVANKKKGRSQTILNQAQGLGSSTANTMKKTLGA